MALPRDLFAPISTDGDLPEGIFALPGLVDEEEQERLFQDVRRIAVVAPLAQARVKGGGLTSAAMTNCGAAGWWSDPKGYRYEARHPVTGGPWPPMPSSFLEVMARAAARSPWPGFVPDACLINFYAPGARMGLHQDRDERDFTQPIMTVSLGDDADFLIGGFARADKTRALIVRSGDVLIMGGGSRLRFHGIRKIYPGTSPQLNIGGRYSLTFRKAL